ncbi:MAG: PIN domain-containing protein [Alphaproteobacteria bacterium]
MFDTNALFHFCVRELILQESKAGRLTPFWSARTVAELRGVLSGRGRSDAEAFFTQLSTSTVPASSPEELKGFRDASDLHVVQAARDAQASVIVTENARDFPVRHLRPMGIDRLSPDDFFAAHLRELPSSMSRTDLQRAGLSRTAKRF